MKKRPRLREFIYGDDRLHNDTVIDSPSTVSNYRYLLGALRSHAPGQWSANVLELSRHYLSTVFLAINTLQKHAAAAEKKIMEKTPDPKDGDRELPYYEPVCRFFDDPNSEDEWSDVADSITLQLNLTGSALVWTPTLDTSVPEEMYVIPTASALPWPPSPVYPHGSYLIQPYYPYGPFSTIPSYQSAAGARIPADQIIRIKNTHPFLRYDGYAVLTAISRIVDTIEGIDLSRWNTQQRGIEASWAATLDLEQLNPGQTDFEKLRRQLEAVSAGPQNAGKLFLVPAGMRVTKISNTPSEMAWESGWEQLTSFALACFGVPKAIAGLGDAESYASLYAKLKQFSILSLNPLLRKIAGKLTKMLIRPYYGDELYLHLTPERIDDHELLEKQLTTDLQAKIRTKNEWRQLRELDPIEGPEGEEWVGEEAKEQQPEMPQGKPMNGKLDSLMGESLGALKKEANGDMPKNNMGEGSLGPRKGLNGDRLAGILDKAKINGTATPIGSYNDGAAEFVKR